MCKRVCAQKIAKASVTSCFFLLVSPFSYCHIFASSHLNLITSSHLQMFTPFISSHHTSSHFPIFTYPPISFYVCLIHLHLLSFRHLHIFPSQLHISLYSSSLSGHPSSSFPRVPPTFPARRLHHEAAIRATAGLGEHLLRKPGCDG